MCFSIVLFLLAAHYARFTESILNGWTVGTTDMEAATQTHNVRLYVDPETCDVGFHCTGTLFAYNKVSRRPMVLTAANCFVGHRNKPTRWNDTELDKSEKFYTWKGYVKIDYGIPLSGFFKLRATHNNGYVKIPAAYHNTSFALNPANDFVIIEIPFDCWSKVTREVTVRGVQPKQVSLPNCQPFEDDMTKYCYSNMKNEREAAMMGWGPYESKKLTRGYFETVDLLAMPDQTLGVYKFLKSATQPIYFATLKKGFVDSFENKTVAKVVHGDEGAVLYCEAQAIVSDPVKTAIGGVFSKTIQLNGTDYYLGATIDYIRPFFQYIHKNVEKVPYSNQQCYPGRM